MKRRDFLKAVAVGVGALIVGCGDDDETSNNANAANATNNTNNTNNAPNCPPGETELGPQFFPQSLASGDPTDTTVVLWTRVADGDADVTVKLQVSLDESFADLFELGEGTCSLELTAEAAYDHCVKVRLENLTPGTYYYYRFIYEKDGTAYATNIGRTKTAPAPDADVAAKFAFVSCQDFNGKYYNSYKSMVQQDDIDFFVHLGDYVYETTGDPQFQMTTPDRVVNFSDEAGAIVFNEGTEDEYFAAKSLSNYRELYQIYRTDPWLQRAHERFPSVVIWDDHEFSDDCFGATATYFDGREDETDVPRRMAANQAWYEHMPVDYLDDPDFRYDPNATYGEDIRIWRDIRWGKNLHLVMTDLRSYRADHVIPEDLFPGKVLMDEAALTAAVGSLPDWADPYVDIDTYDGGSYATLLKDQAGLPEAEVTGNQSVTYINVVVASLNENLDEADQIAAIDPTGLERGLTTISMGKSGVTGQLGSRYLVVDEPFGVWAKAMYDESNGATENTLGDAQEAWFLDTMTSSDATWKVWGNEYTLMQRIVDLSTFEATIGPLFAKKFLLSAEDWDGQRNKRDELLGKLADVDNVVAITGDIHAFFAGTPFVAGDPSKRIVEFVTGAVSSGSMKTLLVNTATSDPALAAAGAGALAAGVESFLFGSNSPNPMLGFGITDEQGYAIAEVDASNFTCTFHHIEEKHVDEDLDVSALPSLFKQSSFRVPAGESDVYMQEDGGEKKWDPENTEWV